MENIVSASTYVGRLRLLQSPMVEGIAILLISLLALFVSHILFISRKKKWPPSPPVLPLLGNLHQVSKGDNFLSVLTNMAKSYGPVMTVWLGLSPLVVLTGQTAIWEALVNQASNFASRPPVYSRQFTSANYKTTIMSPSGEHWSKLRKVLHKNVLSPSHVALQSSSHQISVSHLIDTLEKEMKDNEGVVRPLHALKMVAMSFIATLCFGPHFEDQSFLTELEQLIAEDIRLTDAGDTVIDWFPYARHFVPSSIRAQKEWKALRANVLQVLLPSIKFARSNRGYLRQSAPNCFLNCMLSIGEGEDEDPKSKLSDEEIAFNLHELFLLSVDSTSTSTEWALAYLINHPHMQEKAYEEVNKAAREGEGEVLRLEDLGKLPYVQAIVKETLRKGSIAPLAFFHQTVDECKVMGITIPAKSIVAFNLHGVSNDPGVWKDPDEFRPERFLGDVERDKVRKSYLPFGAGRRVCAGMDVASVHIPINLANLLNKFHWTCVDEGSPSDVSPGVSSLLMFMKHRLQARITCRKRNMP